MRPKVLSLTRSDKMKNTKLLLIAAALTLTACGGNSANSSVNSEVVSSIDATSEAPSSVVPSSSSSINPAVANSKWGNEAAQACFDAVGVVVPYFEADAFDYKVVTDDFGDPAVWFYLYYETQEIAESKIVDYAYAAYEQESYECVVQPTWFRDETDYTMWQQNVLYADKVLDNLHAVEMQVLASVKSYNGTLKGCLGIYCFTYVPNIDETSFPSYAVESLIGENTIPTLAGIEGLKFHFTFFYNGVDRGIEITVKSDNLSYLLEEEYFNELLAADYMLSQFDEMYREPVDGGIFRKGDTYPGFTDEYSFDAYPPEGDYCLNFDYSLDSQVLFIDIFPLD